MKADTSEPCWMTDKMGLSPLLCREQLRSCDAQQYSPFPLTLCLSILSLGSFSHM